MLNRAIVANSDCKCVVGLRSVIIYVLPHVSRLLPSTTTTTRLPEGVCVRSSKAPRAAGSHTASPAPEFRLPCWFRPHCPMADLRRPHERRSDQLSVLVRRPLSVANFVPRFLRTTDIAPSPQSFRFDDYDSDQETDANSEIIGRIRRSSSASAISVVSIPSEPPRRPPPPSISHPESRKPPAVIIDSGPVAHFTRSRAKSFYGAAADVALDKESPDDSDDEKGDGDDSDDDFVTADEIYSKNKVSEKSLRGALGEDYDLFLPHQPASAPDFSLSKFTQDKKSSSDSLKALPESPQLSTTTTEEAKSPTEVLPKLRSRSPSPKRLSSGGLSISSVSPEPDDDEIDEDTDLSLARQRAATSPVLGRHNGEGSIEYISSEQAGGTEQESKRGGNLVRRLVSATNPRIALNGGILPRRSEQRRSRSNADPADTELTARADELRHLIADSRAAKGCGEHGIPLFVEEAGRAPRVAFVNGDLKRVRVRRSSVEGGGSRNLRSSMRFGVAGGYRKRRASGARRRNGGRGFAFGFVRRLQEVDRKMHSRRNRKMRTGQTRGRRRYASNDIIAAAHNSGVLRPSDPSFDHAAARPIDSASTTTTKRNFNLLGKWAHR